MAAEIPLLVLPRGAWPVRANKSAGKSLVELLLRSTVVAIAFPLLCVTCGWYLLVLIPDLDREERLGAAGGVGAAFLAAGAFVAFLTGWPPLLIGGGFVLLFIGVVLFARLRLPRQRSATPTPLWPLGGLSD